MAKPNKNSLKKIDLIYEHYEKEGRLTVRRIYYILLGYGLISQGKSSYVGLPDRLTEWREDGYIDADIIIDRHRQLIISATYSDFQEAFDECCESFSLNSMNHQSQYVEAWIEKDTMTPMFSETCLLYDVPLVVGKGFTSFTFKRDFVKRLGEQIHRPCRLLYFGDFDAEGNYIPQLVEKFLEGRLPQFDFKLKKVLLTEKDLPSIRQFAIEDEGLKNEKHREKAYVQEYVEKYGMLKYEVEAIPFDEVKRRFKEALFSEIDVAVVEQIGEMAEKNKSEWLKKHYRR